MHRMWVTRAVLGCVAVLALVCEAWALPAPTTLLGGQGINSWRDLDTQVPSSPDVAYVTEDRVGPGGYVGPSEGGQQYDWEGLYFWRTATHAYVVLVTGFRILPGNIDRAAPAPSSPDSGIAGVDFTDGSDPVVYAGDLLVDTGQDGIWDYGITLGAYTGANGRAGMTYGDLYLVDTTGGYAGTGTYRSGYTEASPWIGLADSILTGLDYSTQKIFVKQQAGEDMNRSSEWMARRLVAFEIDLSLFPDFVGIPLTWHWTMECGNDEGNLEVPVPTPPFIVPEPATLLLLGAGAWLIRRRRRRAPKR